eukprot:2235329-Karenia_brevis.AAC.1
MFLIPYAPGKAMWSKGCVNEGHAASKANNVEIEEPVDDQAHTHSAPLQKLLHLAFLFAHI